MADAPADVVGPDVDEGASAVDNDDAAAVAEVDEGSSLIDEETACDGRLAADADETDVPWWLSDSLRPRTGLDSCLLSLR